MANGLDSTSELRFELEQDASQEPVFSPVDGGVGRACRGASTGDNKAEYFQVPGLLWAAVPRLFEIWDIGSAEE